MVQLMGLFEVGFQVGIPSFVSVILRCSMILHHFNAEKIWVTEASQITESWECFNELEIVSNTDSAFKN